MKALTLNVLNVSIRTEHEAGEPYICMTVETDRDGQERFLKFRTVVSANDAIMLPKQDPPLLRAAFWALEMASRTIATVNHPGADDVSPTILTMQAFATDESSDDEPGSTRA